MKKLILASCILGTSLCTPAVFADPCNFTLNFDMSVWGPVTGWTVIVTDNTNTNEVVGGPSISSGVFKNPLKVSVSNCSKSTQIGIFAHAPGPKTGMSPNSYAANFLAGMAHCVGDLGDKATNWSDIQLKVGNPSVPSDFSFGPAGNQGDYWTKSQLNVICANPAAPATEQNDDGSN